jgi:DNA-binding response OmpR family regulator
MKHSVLIVEDDEDLAAHLVQYLHLRGFMADCATDGSMAKQLLLKKQYDVLLVDVMMPKVDGFTLAMHLKSSHPKVPFLFLTARNQQEDVLKGLSLGADDYIIKPFDPEELVLRLHNIIRRCKGNISEPEAYQLGMYTFQFSNLLLIGPLSQRTLTDKEAQLLRVLSVNKGHLVNKDLVLRELWGEPDFLNKRSLDVFISRLRKYLSEDARVQIQSIRGVGLRLSEQTSPLSYLAKNGDFGENL